jgi:gliding motility-associated-like protein
MPTWPRFIYRSGILVCLLVIAGSHAVAQYEFLATLDYNNLTINRIGNTPGVTWINGVNSTYDQNNQRFFFLGNANRVAPWYLYTIDAVTGATIYNPLCPTGMSGQIIGLQYDNAVDTLYGIYFSNGSGAVCWIDPSTGTVHPKKNIPGYIGTVGSTYDTKDHFYITGDGTDLLVIDAFTGSVVYNSPATLTHVSNMMYDNLTGKLYGIDLGTGSFPRFDSITISTGALHVISNLPAMVLQSTLTTFSIDELAGKYIFMGTDPPTVDCFSNYLYVLDIHSGAVLSKTPYPFYQSPTEFTVENLIEFSFDNTRGKLYALNWHPPGNPNSSLNIFASPTPPCPGSSILFQAVPSAGAMNPIYQWQVNRKNVGTNSFTYTDSNLIAGDSVRCILSFQATCIPDRTDTSYSIVIPSVAKASITIGANVSTACAGLPVIFTAHTINSGSPAVFQWLQNDIPVGTNDSVFTTSSLTNGDSVRCMLTTNSNCTIPGPDSSNSVVMQVTSFYPSVSISASSSAICSGDTVIFTAVPVNGGTEPAYQWKINGTPAGANQDSFMTSSLGMNDTVTCVLTGSEACSVPALSNPLTILVNPAPVLFVGNDTVISPGQILQLHPEVTGTISTWLWTPSTYLDNSFIADPVFTPGVTTNYQLLITSDAGCTTSGKMTIVVYRPLKMPNAFTPNNDGLNDVFRIPPSTPQKIKSFSVYNRWGGLIFHTSDSGIGWDGTFHGQPLSNDTYVWMIEYEDLLTKKTETASGTVILIR